MAEELSRRKGQRGNQFQFVQARRFSAVLSDHEPLEIRMRLDEARSESSLAQPMMELQTVLMVSWDVVDEMR